MSDEISHYRRLIQQHKDAIDRLESHIREIQSQDAMKEEEDNSTQGWWGSFELIKREKKKALDAMWYFFLCFCLTFTRLYWFLNFLRKNVLEVFVAHCVFYFLLLNFISLYCSKVWTDHHCSIFIYVFIQIILNCIYYMSVIIVQK